LGDKISSRDTTDGYGGKEKVTTLQRAEREKKIKQKHFDIAGVRELKGKAKQGKKRAGKRDNANLMHRKGVGERTTKGREKKRKLNQNHRGNG